MSFTPSKPLIIGSRGSDLALWQANWVQGALQIPSRIQVIKTQGDVIHEIPLSETDGKGFFTKELEEHLLQEKIDCAVHSLKDLPTRLPAHLSVCAVPKRANPADWLVIHPEAFDPLRFEKNPLGVPLKEGAVVGTSSPRRERQLQWMRPDVELKNIRGNVPTRLEKLRRREYGALLMAGAGLERLSLDLSEWVVFRFHPWHFLPSPGQGALGIEIRETNRLAAKEIQKLHDEKTAVAVSFERALLEKFGGGCHLALGAYAEMKEGDQVSLSAWIAPELKKSKIPWSATVLGERQEVVAKLLEAASGRAPLTGKRMWIVRPKKPFDRLQMELQGLGAEVHLVSPLEFMLLSHWSKSLETQLEGVLKRLRSQVLSSVYFSFTSGFSSEVFIRALQCLKKPVFQELLARLTDQEGAFLSAIGVSTEKTITSLGLPVLDLTSFGFPFENGEAHARGLSEFLEKYEKLEKVEVFCPGGRNKAGGFSEFLRTRGISLLEFPFYELSSIPFQLPEEKPDAVVWMNPLSVEEVAKSVSFQNELFLNAHQIAIGGTTAKKLNDCGILHPVSPKSSEREALLQTIQNLLISGS